MHPNPSEEDLRKRALPKWPQMVVTGFRLSEHRALEVIRRTDSWFVFAYGCNDRDGDRRLAPRFRMAHYHDYAAQRPVNFDWGEREARWKKAWGALDTRYVRNNWIGSSGGPHGWCHPDGRIYYENNIGKWPAVAEIQEEWKMLAEAFPFLRLTVTLMSGEACEDHSRAVVTMHVAEGQVKLKKPDDGDHGDPGLYAVRGPDGAAQSWTHPERYPFREEVFCAWEKKALEVDAEINMPR